MARKNKLGIKRKKIGGHAKDDEGVGEGRIGLLEANVATTNLLRNRVY
jgi:hypothetical protein